MSVYFVKADCPRPSPSPDDRDLYIRIWGEFREMPGLILTVQQAARLFAVERNRCERVLTALVRDSVLATDGFTFARPERGPVGEQDRLHR